jgi:hypothetical protein
LPRRFGFAGLEPGDRRGGGAGDLDEQLPGVVDAEADVGLFDGDGLAGVPDPDLDALSGGADAARVLTRRSTRSSVVAGAGAGAGVAQTGQIGQGERVRQGSVLSRSARSDTAICSATPKRLRAFLYKPQREFSHFNGRRTSEQTSEISGRRIWHATNPTCLS